MAVDKRGVLEKVIGFFKGDSVEFDGTDAMTAVETGTGFLPGMGQVVQPIVTAPAEAMRASRNLEWIQENFGVSSVERQAAIDPLFKQEIDAVDGLIVKAVTSSAAGAVGGAAGGWAGLETGGAAGFAVGGPVGATIGGGLGFIVGAFAGGTAASYPVDYILAKPRTDAFAVVGAIQEDIKSGAGIDPRKVFVNLAASLPPESLPVDPETNENYIQKQLRILSDGKIKSLQEALEKQPEILDAMMFDANIDNKIKQYNNMLVVGDITDKSGNFSAPTATELFTQKLEEGVDPRILLLRQKRMELVEVMNMELAQEVSAPMQTMSDDPVSQDVPRRDASKGHRRKASQQAAV